MEMLINKIPPLTYEQIKKLQTLRDEDIVYDENSPESTEVMLKSFNHCAKMRDVYNNNHSE